MPSWKKVIVSGSDASLNSLYSPSITGSLQGTASFATTASFALNGGTATFPYTGSAIITGSLVVTGSITSTQTISGSRLYLSSSAANTITIIGSGSDLLTIDGTVGRLFAVTDDLSDSLFSVNTVAGLPVIEAFATNNVNLGKFGTYPIKIINSGSTAVVSGSFTGSMVGNLTGTSSFATTASFALNAISSSFASTASFIQTAQTSSTSTVTDTTTGVGPYYVTFTDGTTGARSLRVDSAALTFNATTNVLSTTASFASTASYILNAVSASFSTTASYVLNSISASFASTASYVLNAVSASFSNTASYVNTLNQNVLITGSLTIGTSSIGSGENTLILGPAPNGGSGEGGQLLFQATGGTYTSASMLDNYQNRFRLLRGINAGSDLEIASFNMHSGQLVMNKYTGSGAFPGTAAGFLAVDSSGNVITATGAGGSTTPGGSNTQIQYNNSNAFGGVPVLTYDGTTLRATGSFTGSLIGSLTGTASFATTASFALNGGSGAAFPYTGSAIITGSLTVTGSVSITQNVTASRAIVSGSTSTTSGSVLTVIGSGSTQPVFTVIGSSGELFSITDSLSGSLFSVNDISGLPILEVFSDNTTVIGDYQAPSLLTTKKATLNTGNNVIYNIPTASYDGVWFDYTITSASNARCGTVMAIRNGSSIVYTETTTTDIGSTSGVTFMVMITGSNMALTGSVTSPSWSFKSIIRSI